MAQRRVTAQARHHFRRRLPDGILPVSSGPPKPFRIMRREDCGDALCDHGTCRRLRESARKAAMTEPGLCGQVLRFKPCRHPAGACPIHDRRRGGAGSTW